MELKEGIILYCESVRWDVPSELVRRVGLLLHLFEKDSTLWSFRMAHVQTPLGQLHTCTEMSLNYSLQRCGDVCGFVAIVFTARVS